MFLLIAVAVLVSVVGTAGVAYAGYWSTAYKVDVAFNDPWWNPHYGAFQAGCYGSQQYFTGASGAPAEYSSWNWWGGCYNVLLLEKSWLFTVPSHSDRWDGSDHHAWMAYQ
jgi:hypothetical protein